VAVPFFYGWLIVAIAMLAGFLASGVSNITMAVVLKPISADLGWSRTLTAVAITAGSMLGGILAPIFGPVADRLGPRFLLPGGAAAVGSLVIALGLSTEPWQFYATFVPARALTEFLLCGVVPLTAVANWFYLMRPRAMGLVAMSVPLGSSALSLVYQYLVTTHGWRSAFLVLGISLWVLVVIPGVFFLRRQPEDLGLRPDGGVADFFSDGGKETGEESLAHEPEQSWRQRDAMRTSSLWLLVAGTFLASLGTGGIAFHLVAYFTDVKITPVIAAAALSVMALSGALGSGFWGAIAERVHPRNLSIVAMTLAAASAALLTQVRMPVAAFVFAVLFGINARGTAVLTQILLARYYGRHAYGAISSVLDPFHKGGLGLGALFAGVAFDFFGDYQRIFVVFLICYLVAALLVFMAQRPEPRLKIRARCVVP
jgi:MFS family permease